MRFVNILKHNWLVAETFLTILIFHIHFWYFTNNFAYLLVCVAQIFLLMFYIHFHWCCTNIFLMLHTHFFNVTMFHWCCTNIIADVEKILLTDVAQTFLLFMHTQLLLCCINICTDVAQIFLLMLHKYFSNVAHTFLRHTNRFLSMLPKLHKHCCLCYTNIFACGTNIVAFFAHTFLLQKLICHNIIASHCQIKNIVIFTKFMV